MPYTVNYTDSSQKTPITVFDNTSNTDTSLTFPGRNVTGYGQAIAENFLALLENFSSPSAPSNPVEGQVWFNSNPAVASLLIWDGSSWKSASGVQKSPVQPGIDESKIGELWVDTVNQQLNVFSGSDWVLVGPSFSSGLRSGLRVAELVDSNDISRVVLIVDVEDKPIIIISKDSFTPKEVIPQFSVIRAGINIAAPDANVLSETAIYAGGFLPKLHGSATSADGLQVSGNTIDASKFLRSDIVNVVDNGINIKSDTGVTIGLDSTFSITTSANAVNLYNNFAGSSIDLQSNVSGRPTTVLRVVNGNVGINTLSPTESFVVTGTSQLNGKLFVSDTSLASDAGTGSTVIAGGMFVAKNAIVNNQLTVNSKSFLQHIVPQSSNTYDLGTPTQRWNSIVTKTVIAETIQGALEGSINGNALTATSLQQQTTFSISGDITAPSFQFNGIVGGLSKTFITSISPGLITSKEDINALSAPQKSYSLSDDYVLIYRPTVSGLLKATRDTFVGDLGVPIGTILPFAGNAVPFGYILCDGSEVLIAKYTALYQVIGSLYNGASALLGTATFRLPDLRGRFPLGLDNMDNGTQVSDGSATYDAGGGPAGRVPGIDASTLGGTGGSSEFTLDISSLPNHEHSMKGSTGQQYYASRLDTGVPIDTGASLGAGGTITNQAQYLPTSGGIKTTGETGQPYPVMNPHLALNYIIRCGAPVF